MVEPAHRSDVLALDRSSRLWLPHPPGSEEPPDTQEHPRVAAG